MSVLLPIYTTELGLSPLQVTGLYSVFSFGILMVRIFIGQMTDKFGRKPMFIFALACYAMSYFLYSGANTLPEFYAARCFQAIASAFVGISTACMVADVSNNNSAQNFGRVSAYINQGGLIGIASCFYFLRTKNFAKGWSNLFFFCTAATIFSIIYSLIYLKETKSEDTVSIVDKIKLPPEKIKTLWFTLFFYTMYSMLTAVFVLFAERQYSPGFMDIGIAFMLPAIVTTLTSAPLGKLSDKISYSKSLSLALFSGSLSLFMIPFAPNVYVFAILWTLTSVSTSLFVVTINAIFVSGVDPQNRGAAIGRHTMSVNAGGIFGPVIGGFMMQNISTGSPFILCALAFVALTALGLKWFPTTQKEPSPPQAT